MLIFLIWVDIGSYGKSSDSGVFKNSTLYDRLTKNILNIFEPKPIVENGTMPLPYVIMADEAFGKSNEWTIIILP